MVIIIIIIIIIVVVVIVVVVAISSCGGVGLNSVKGRRHEPNDHLNQQPLATPPPSSLSPSFSSLTTGDAAAVDTSAVLVSC
jgi:hypothetical protein